MTNVNVRIDRLVFHGLRRGTEREVAASFREELIVLLERPGALERLATRGHATAFPPVRVHLPEAATPVRIGVDVARGIDRSIGS